MGVKDLFTFVKDSLRPANIRQSFSFRLCRV